MSLTCHFPSSLHWSSSTVECLVFFGMVTHVQTVDTRPFLSSHMAWVRGYSTELVSPSSTKKLECSLTTLPNLSNKGASAMNTENASLHSKGFIALQYPSGEARFYCRKGGAMSQLKISQPHWSLQY